MGLSVETAILQRKAIQEFVFDHPVRPRYPLCSVSSMLRAVARTAGGHDVAWSGLASLANGFDVIPSARRGVAVGAHSTKILKQNLLGFRRNRGDATLACVRVLSTFRAISLVRSVALASLFVGVSATQSLARFAQRSPVATAPAPRKANRFLKSPLACAWPRLRLSNVAAPPALGSKTIAASPICAEFANRTPVPATSAPFQALRQAIRVFLERETKLSGRNYSASSPASHGHPFLPLLCPLYLTRRAL